jgi:hypothetical protein
VLGDRVEQGHGLQAVARGPLANLVDDPSGVDRVLHGGDEQPLAELGHAAIAEGDDLREVVARVDVHEREGEARGPEGLLGQAQQDDRVLAAREEEHGPLELCGDLAHDVDGLALERFEVRQLVVHRLGTPSRGAGEIGVPAREVREACDPKKGGGAHVRGHDSARRQAQA